MHRSESTISSTAGAGAAPSAQVCAGARGRSGTEQEHLFRLAGHATEGGRIRRLAQAGVRRLVERLSARSEPFRALWRRPEVAEHGPTVKRITHSEVGLLELDCDILRTHRGDPRIVT
ncbi:MmyB family transcriptional regulator [Streptomyces albidoflavus]|uniref:MmyB family transcriptional regulator n=1 Tax=Streptomyces albidoflavus TaxID=1886 RepID=UPI001596D7CB|nr:hypothetical protein [Streptomyces albidoflavus]